MREVDLYSTLAQDVLLRESGEIISRQEGGPLMFMEHVFKEEGVSFISHPGVFMKVEILINDQGEFGKINPPERKIQAENSSNWIVISTLLDEWDISELRSDSPNIFLDIQGFVRDGSVFGKKKHWTPTLKLQDSILCMKGTEEELGYIPPEVLENQKERILLSTMGGNGLDLFWNSQKFHIPAKTVKNLPNTVGAGDTFFSYFISYFIRGNSPEESANYATDKTAIFLESKKDK